MDMDKWDPISQFVGGIGLIVCAVAIIFFHASHEQVATISMTVMLIFFIIEAIASALGPFIKPMIEDGSACKDKYGLLKVDYSSAVIHIISPVAVVIGYGIWLGIISMIFDHISLGTAIGTLFMFGLCGVIYAVVTAIINLIVFAISKGVQKMNLKQIYNARDLCIKIIPSYLNQEGIGGFFDVIAYCKKDPRLQSYTRFLKYNGLFVDALDMLLESDKMIDCINYKSKSSAYEEYKYNDSVFISLDQKKAAHTSCDSTILLSVDEVGLASSEQILDFCKERKTDYPKFMHEFFFISEGLNNLSKQNKIERIKTHEEGSMRDTILYRTKNPAKLSEVREEISLD